MNKVIRSIAALAAISTASVVVYAQTDAATLSGTVTDATGAVVPGAVVKVHNDANGFERTANANSAGVYSFQALPIGTYKETVSFTGFGNFSTSITLNVGANATIDAKLGASSAQTVEVTTGDEGTQVNLSNQETSTIITSKQLVDLPTLTRNPYDFVVLSGAVNSDPNGSTARGVGASLNGQRSSGTEILLDGVENADAYDATVGQPIPEDSVQEYRIIINGFDAQYGRASGGIVNLVTKSGTNRFHGSLYEFNRVSALGANTYYESSSNSAAIAANPASPDLLTPDHYTQNQFGYSIGGRVLRDKLFFFNNYEWDRVRSEGSAQFEIPTAAYLATTAANTQAFFAQYGKVAASTKLGATEAVSGYVGPNPLQLATVQAPIDAGAGAPVNGVLGVSRLDYNLSNKITMYMRVATDKVTNFPGAISLSPYNGFNTTNTNFNQSYLFNLNYIITPNIVSSSKVSFSRVNVNQPLGTAGIAPSLYLNQANVASRDPNGQIVALPGYLPTSPGGAIPFGGPANTYQFLEDVSYTRGKHTFKAGGQFLQIRDNRTFGAYENAVAQVAKTGTGAGAALTSLAQGNIYSFEVALNPQGKLPCSYNAAGTLVTTASCSITLPATSPNFERQNTFNDGNWYVEDSWKVTSRLTVNAGIRWEYYGVQHNHDPNLESNFFLGPGNNLPAQIQSGQLATTPNSPVGGLVKKDLNNYAPRVGFAYDPVGNGKWAIRGGYGISYERNFGNVTYNVIQNPPNYAGVTLSSTGGTQLTLSNSNFGPFGAGSGTVGLAPPSLRALQQDMPTAYTHQYNFTVEHEISHNDLISIFYTGARGVHLYSIANVNGYGYGAFVGYPNGILSAAPSYHNDRINPQYGAINIREANGDSHYDALNIAFKANNLSHYGLQLTVNYTLAHDLDNLSSTFSESGNNFNLGYLNPFNPRLDYGNSDNDTRHRVVIGGIYEPSFLEFKSHKVLHTLAGGIEFAPIAVLRTGTPFTVYDCTYGYNACPRVIAAPGEQFHSGTTATGYDQFAFMNIPAAAANPFFNNQGISDIPSTYGGYQNQGLDRNQWYSPSNVQFDMGVYKNFNIGAENRYKLQLRGEFYDILNHHNYYALAGGADVSNGFTNGFFNVGAIKGSPTGSPTSADERRKVQIAARIEF